MRQKSRWLKKWRKSVLCSVLFLGICGSMTACGGYATGNVGTESSVSGNAVSGSAVSDGAVKTEERTQQERTDGIDGTMRFNTDTNQYYDDYKSVSSDKERLKLMQRKWDGTEAKEILAEEELSDFYGVAGGWLYYEDQK